MVSLFPNLVEFKQNKSLVKEVSMEELKEIINVFQKDKSLGLYGWLIEFYVSFFNLLGKDLLLVLEESKRVDKVLGALNSTFIALIPKRDYLRTFEYFKPFPSIMQSTRLFLKSLPKS